jgi:GDP-L-fucose synthase
MNTDSRIYVAGHKGMVGSAIVHELERSGFRRLILKTKKELDLTHQQDVERFFA